jgi:hypothetical protein
MSEEKNKYKIWNWEITKQERPMSMNPTGKPQYWYAIEGLSDQYIQGRAIRSSRIIRLDFDAGVVETKNSIYSLQEGEFVSPMDTPTVS